MPHDVSSDLTVAQVAEKYGVHINTVRNWIRDGVLPAYRIGARTIRIRPSDVAAVATPLEGGDRGFWSRIA
jgi:excisionase family DNA binding protein